MSVGSTIALIRVFGRLHSQCSTAPAHSGGLKTFLNSFYEHPVGQSSKLVVLPSFFQHLKEFLSKLTSFAGILVCLLFCGGSCQEKMRRMSD